MRDDATGSAEPLGAARGRALPSPIDFHRARERLSLRDELVLAAVPTLLVIAVLALVDAISEQRNCSRR